MKNAIVLIIVIILLSAGNAIAGSNIGFGTIKGIKIGPNNDDVLEVYLATGFTHDTGGCNGVVYLRPEVLSSDKLDRIYALVLAAQLNGKKVRFYSHIDTCDATFAALQDDYF